MFVDHPVGKFPTLESDFQLCHVAVATKAQYAAGKTTQTTKS